MPYLETIEFVTELEIIDAGAFPDCSNVTKIKLKSRGVTLGNNTLFLFIEDEEELSFVNCEIQVPAYQLYGYQNARN